MTRRSWLDLPSSVRSAIHEHTAHVEKVEPIAAGSIASIAAVIHTSGVAQFCKGIEVTNPRAWMVRNEARFNTSLPQRIVPALRWTVECDGWLLLGFDYADGRHADLTVGSPDLPRIATTLDQISAALTPCRVDRVQPATARWADRIAPELVDGDTLLHTDVTPRNFLVGDDVAVVDWSAPCRGAPWIDTALMVVRLIRAGHTPQQAEQWAASVAIWATAPSAALDAFSAATAKLYTQRHHESPAPHRRELASAAQRWALLRGHDG